MGQNGLAPSGKLAVLIVLLLTLAGGLLYLDGNSRTAGATSRSSSIPNTSTSSRTALVTTNSTSTTISGEWYTYHRDFNRSGYDQTQRRVNSIEFDWRSQVLDGYAYAEPLLVGGTLIVATENNSVYALDVNDGSEIWKAPFGNPVPLSDLPCGNIDPSGITGTPVFDKASSRIYAVAFVGSGHRHLLFGLDFVTGKVVFNASADPPGANPLVEQQRGALAVYGDTVYVPYGGLYGDCGDYKGAIVAVPTNSSQVTKSFTVPTNSGGGIWAPSGESIDRSGNVFVSTGNSFSTSSFDFGESVLRLSPSLSRLDWFAPSNWAKLNSGDVDLGSTGPAILDHGVIFAAGKEGTAYLLNENHLGGIGGELYSSQICDGAYGATAYAAPLLFVSCSNGLVSLQLAPDRSSFNVLWRGPSFPAGPPVVSGGLVWTIGTGDGELRAFSTTDGAQFFRYQLGIVVHFSSLCSGGGHLFAAAGRSVVAFGISS